MKLSTTIEILTKEKYDVRVFSVGLLGFDVENLHSSEFKIEQKVVEYKSLRNIDLEHISCGGYHCSFLTETNQLQSIGWNFLGQCGTGDFENCFKPTDVYLAENIKIKQVKSSGRHSLILTNEVKYHK